MTRQGVFDAANTTAAATYLASLFAGYSWEQWAAMFAAVYGFLIMCEKAASIAGRLQVWWKGRARGRAS